MKVLVVAPHMDDEVLGAGGTIVRHVAAGDEVHVCIIANRAYDHTYDPDAIAREEGAVQEAQKMLGYHDLRFLRLPDEQLDRGLIDVIVPLERTHTEIRPDIVYTCHHGDANQDHGPVFRATAIVCRPIGPYPPRRLISYEVPSSTDQAPPVAGAQFAPNYYVRLTDSMLDKKVAAMSCYERESRTFPHPRSPEGVVTHARKRGMEVRWEAAEAFMLLRDLTNG